MKQKTAILQNTTTPSTPSHNPMKTTTPNHQPSDTQPADLVPLQYAAKHFQIKEVTLRSWCKKGKIPWESRMQGDKARRFVHISEVHAFLAKKTPVITTAALVQPEVVPPIEQPHAAAGALISPESPGKIKCPADCSPPQSAQSTQQTPVLTEAALPNLKTAEDCKRSQSYTPETTPSTKTEGGQILASPEASVSLAQTGKETSSMMPVAKSNEPKPSCRLLHNAKNAMRKFGPEDLQKIGTWIIQRLANKHASNSNPTPSTQPTPAS